MLEPWLAWRLLKFLGLALFAAGLGGVVFSRAQSRRMWNLHLPTTLGLGLCWLSGYGMTKLTGASIRDPWIATSLLASLFALHEAAALAWRPKVRPFQVGLLILGAAASVGAMVVRVPGPAQWLAVGVIPAAMGAMGHGFAGRALEQEAWDYDPEVVAPATQQWFTWIARIEGLSLVVLLGVYMPLKHLAGINLDGGQGWFGWFHGMMVLIYMQALFSAWRGLRWSLPRVAAGFVASLVPFGTFVFERRVFSK